MRNYARGAAHWKWSGGFDPVKRRANAKASAKKYPERRRAREKVKDAVRRGSLPWIRSQSCVDCGIPARAYDHHLGYHLPLEVQPVCFTCHGRRSRYRGEHLRAGRLPDGRTWDEVPT